jgi:glycine/D-amino acid oxidase-like deaminating enzyme
VQVSRDRIIRTVAGLRPFRPSGFVVRGQKMGDKTVIHNYGHGGGGVTLSWGTASLAVEEAAKTGAARMAVLGCGAVGLATARLLQQRGVQTTIYAKDLPPSTTSNIAGAQWFPVTVYDRDHVTPAFVDQFIRASRFSYRWYQTMVGDYYGIRWIPNYICSREPFFEDGLLGQKSPIRDVIPEMHDLAAGENPFPYPHVRQFTTMLIEPPVYLNAVLRDFRIAGGAVIVRDFASVEQILELPESVIVNCTGLGAKALFKDDELMPIKGQLTFLLPQPEVDLCHVASRWALHVSPARWDIAGRHA